MTCFNWTFWEIAIVIIKSDSWTKRLLVFELGDHSVWSGGWPFKGPPWSEISVWLMMYAEQKSGLSASRRCSHLTWLDHRGNSCLQQAKWLSLFGFPIPIENPLDDIVDESCRELPEGLTLPGLSSVCPLTCVFTESSRSALWGAPGAVFQDDA